MNGSPWSQSLRGMAHAGNETHFLLEAMRAHQALVQAFSRRVGEAFSRLSLLRVIAVGPPGGTGVLAIARKLGVNAAAVTRLIQEMERERLVSRRRDPRDGRKSYVKLTRKGRRRLVLIHEGAHEFERMLLTGIKAADLAAAQRVLQSLRAAAEGMD